MNKNLVLSKNEVKSYTLLARLKEDGTVREYCVAWKFNAETDSWGQGHYFSRLEDAMDYMYSDEILTWVAKAMQYVDDNVEGFDTFKELADEDDGEYLRTVLVDGLYQD